jgi:hypothetical protein
VELNLKGDGTCHLGRIPYQSVMIMLKNKVIAAL